MESALLSASAILPLQNKEVCGVLRKWQSSFYGKGICNGVLVRRSISYAGRRSPLTVSSVLGRKVKKVKKETIVPDPDYRIPVVLLGAAGSLIYTDNLLAAAPIGLLGLLLLFQTTRVRFVFDDEALVQSYRICQLQAHNLKVILDQGSQCNASAGINHTDILLALVICVLLEVKVGEQLEQSGENVFVGGKNRWKYSTFVNWELWWPNFPVLVYFKETQTKPEGQVHFFPVIFNGKQLYDVMVERCGSSKTSSPK